MISAYQPKPGVTCDIAWIKEIPSGVKYLLVSKPFGTYTTGNLKPRASIICFSFLCAPLPCLGPGPRLKVSHTVSTQHVYLRRNRSWPRRGLACQSLLLELWIWREMAPDHSTHWRHLGKPCGGRSGLRAEHLPPHTVWSGMPVSILSARVSQQGLLPVSFLSRQPRAFLSTLFKGVALLFA